ncbi:sugar diacid recognition domain-containing protein, partial [Streptomyces asiaticus]
LITDPGAVVIGCGDLARVGTVHEASLEVVRTGVRVRGGLAVVCVRSGLAVVPAVSTAIRVRPHGA